MTGLGRPRELFPTLGAELPRSYGTVMDPGHLKNFLVIMGNIKLFNFCKIPESLCENMLCEPDCRCRFIWHDGGSLDLNKSCSMTQMDTNYSKVIIGTIEVEGESCEVWHSCLIIVEEDFCAGHLDGVVLLDRSLSKARETRPRYNNIESCGALDINICIFIVCSNVQVIIFRIFTDSSSLPCLV